MTVAALAAPNFSGTWKLNTAKSEFGQLPPPEKFLRTITHHDPSMKYKTEQAGPQGEFTTEVTCTTDGKECTNQYPQGAAKSTMKWEGDTLVVDSKRTIQDNELTFKEKWSLSGDGKTITINFHVSGGFGEFDLKYVLEKQ
jgi:hypothetical protein